MSRTDHVLDAIDGALSWDGASDEMRWRPPKDDHPSPQDRLTPPPQPSVRITVIIERGDEIEIMDIPDPLDVSFNVDVQESPPYFLGPVYALAPSRIELKLGATVGDGGYTVYSGSGAASVLRRFTDALEGGAGVPH